MRAHMVAVRSGSLRRARALARGVGRVPASVEALERRRLLSGFDWTAEEVYLAELINRARANPVLEGQRLGLNIQLDTDGDGDLDIYPTASLPLSDRLGQSIRAHLQDMRDRGFFGQVNPDGDDPTDRSLGALFDGSAEEALARGFESVDAAYLYLMADPVSRALLLRPATSTDVFNGMTDLGIGVLSDGMDSLEWFHGVDIGRSVSGSLNHYVIHGVAFDDADADNFYSVGEGIGNVTVQVARFSTPTSILATTTTGSAGYYRVDLSTPGQYLVTFQNPNTLTTAVSIIEIGRTNVKVDVRATDFGGPMIGDDHADHGQYAFASDAVVFNGNVTLGRGVIETSGDRDLFTFVAAFSGPVRGLYSAGRLFEPNLSVYDSAGNEVTVGDGYAGIDGGAFEFTMVVGQRYYVEMGSVDGTSTGQYAWFVARSGEPVPENAVFDLPLITGAFGGGPLTEMAATELPGGRTAIVASDVGGALRLTVAGADGSSVAYDLGSLLGAPRDYDSMVAWTNASGLLRIGANTLTGLLLFEEKPDGSIVLRDLDAETGGDLIVSNITTFESAFGVRFIAGLNPLGDLVFYRHTTQVNTDDEIVWAYTNITRTQLTPGGFDMPSIADDARLVGYTTRGNRLNVASVDTNGDVQVFFIRPGVPGWRVLNFSELWGTPAFDDAGLAVHVRPFGGVNIVGATPAGQVVTTWWAPGLTDWVNENVSAATGRNVSASTLSAFGNIWQGPSFAGLDASGRTVLYWLTPGTREWRVSLLSEVADGPISIAAPFSIRHVADGASSILSLGAGGDLFRYRWEPGQGWRTEYLG